MKYIDFTPEVVIIVAQILILLSKRILFTILTHNFHYLWWETDMFRWNVFIELFDNFQTGYMVCHINQVKNPLFSSHGQSPTRWREFLLFYPN